MIIEFINLYYVYHIVGLMLIITTFYLSKKLEFYNSSGIDKGDISTALLLLGLVFILGFTIMEMVLFHLFLMVKSISTYYNIDINVANGFDLSELKYLKDEMIKEITKQN